MFNFCHLFVWLILFNDEKVNIICCEIIIIYFFSSSISFVIYLYYLPLYWKIIITARQKHNTLTHIYRYRHFFLINTFDSIESATRVRENLNGCDIYSGCCTLKIDYAKVSYVFYCYLLIFYWFYSWKPVTSMCVRVKGHLCLIWYLFKLCNSICVCSSVWGYTLHRRRMMPPLNWLQLIFIVYVYFFVEPVPSSANIKEIRQDNIWVVNR